MKVIIDRFEGNFAVVEAEGKFVDMPAELVPQGAKEGSVLSITIDETETQNREEKIRSMLNQLFDKSNA